MRLFARIVSRSVGDRIFSTTAIGTPFEKSSPMESTDSVTLGPTIIRDRPSSPWAKTVAVIRVPRFTVFRMTRRADSLPEDPLTAFTAEVELLAANRRWRR